MLKPGMYISDRYEIIDKVGSGGMADVYKAKCHRLNRFVAIKVLKPEFSDDKNFVKKFRGEAQSAAGLSHPNIVNVYDVGDDNGLHYIVMELVEGITLKSFIERKGKLEVKEAIGISIQIALGMEAAHTNHIIHRDIKPQNIIISREGKVKVTDFGIAKATNSNTITSNAMGSVHYLSPEQARGGYSDEKSDIYSLGVTLYEMLTGEVPFAGDNTVSVALLHIQSEAIPLRQIDNTIPYSVEKIVQKCMQKKPERRYLTASDLIQDLKRSISNPNGDFVVIPQTVVSDSPTITITDDEVSSINHQAKLNNPRNTTIPVTNTARVNTPKANSTKGNTGKLNYDEDLEDNTYSNTDPRRKNPLDNIDDEELDSVDPRMEKLLLVGTIAAGVILMIIILIFVSRFLKLFQGNDKVEDNRPGIEEDVTPTPTPIIDDEIGTIIVPSVVGLTLDDALKSLGSLSDKLDVTYTEDFSDEHEKGIVIEQYPKKGAEIPANASVTMVISSGPETKEVPNVYNLTDSNATTKLTEEGFVVEHEFTFSTEIEEGRVIETIPARGEVILKGSTVKMVVSTGPEVTNVEVPNLLNKSQNEALNLLEQAGLARGTISNDYSEDYAAGMIMKQSHEAASLVAKGTEISFTVSLGSGVITTPAPTEEPADNQLYVSKITISDNPFDYPGEKGIILVELEQDGTTKNLVKLEKKYEDFPLTISNIISESNSVGTIRMYVGRQVDSYEDGVVTENGVLIKYEQHDTSWAIEFTPVRD